MIGILIGFLVSQGLWAKAYDGGYIDYGRSIIQTSDGGYAVTGFTRSFGAGLYDFLVLKLGTNGSLTWAKTCGGADVDSAQSIVQATDGGYVLAGLTKSYGAGKEDILVLKLTSTGNLSWARTFGGIEDDKAFSVTRTTDGGYAVAAMTNSYGAGGFDILVLRLSSTGTLSWARTYGGTSSDVAMSIIQTSDGGFAVAGYTYSFGFTLAECFILKLASDGTLTWARTYGDGGFGSDFARSIIQTTDGGFAVAGYTSSFGAGSDDFLVLKITSTGTLSWARAVGGTGWDYGYSIVQATDGGYVVVGETANFGNGLIIKLSSTGNLSWARSFSRSTYSVIRTSDGGYAIAGGDWDIPVMKLSSSGDYPGCLQVCSPTVTTPSLSTSTPSVTTNTPSLTTTTPSPAVSSQTLTVTDVCPPVDLEEGDFTAYTGITCSPLPGGILFVSPDAMDIKIYLADGRVAYSGKLEKGETRISLETGVYLWRAGDVGAGPCACPVYKGKAVVR